MLLQSFLIVSAGEKLLEKDLIIDKQKNNLTIRYSNYKLLEFKKRGDCYIVDFNKNNNITNRNTINTDINICNDKLGLLKDLSIPIFSFNYKYNDHLEYIKYNNYMYINFKNCIQYIEFKNDVYNFVINEKKCNEKIILNNITFKINNKLPNLKENYIPYFKYIDYVYISLIFILIIVLYKKKKKIK